MENAKEQERKLSKEQVERIAEAVGNLKSRLSEAAELFASEVEEIRDELFYKEVAALAMGERASATTGSYLALRAICDGVAELGRDEWGQDFIEPALDELGYYEGA